MLSFICLGELVMICQLCLDYHITRMQTGGIVHILASRKENKRTDQHRALFVACVDTLDIEPIVTMLYTGHGR